ATVLARPAGSTLPPILSSAINGLVRPQVIAVSAPDLSSPARSIINGSMTPVTHLMPLRAPNIIINSSTGRIINGPAKTPLLTVNTANLSAPPRSVINIPGASRVLAVSTTNSNISSPAGG